MYKTTTAKRSILEPLLHDIYPYLGKRRQEQVREMLAHYTTQE